MRIFVDTADTGEIAGLAALGVVDGVTTNPTLIARSGRDVFAVLEEIVALVPGPVSAECVAEDEEGMLREAERLREIGPNIVIKLPLTVAGLRACRRLAEEGVEVNVTLCFSAAQALLAAKAGARYISPFVGRLDDHGHDGMALIGEIVAVYRNYGFETQVLTASVRHPGHVVQAARMGSDVATIPPKVIWQMFSHPLTDRGVESFLADWRATGQSLLS